MNKTKPFSNVRFLCLLLALLLFLPVFSSCGKPKTGKAYMTLGNESLSENMYTLMLTRMRGQLYARGYSVDSPTFWDTVWSSAGATYADYFNYQVLAQCKTYLDAYYLFEETYKLKLEDAYLEEVDRQINDLIEADAQGSRNTMNQILSSYGVNLDILRAFYIIEKKVSALQNYLYYLISDTVKEEYFGEHYVCFKQIALAKFYYVCETDKLGNDIYYTDDSFSKICYDTENGHTRTDSNGNTFVDVNGDPIYYMEDDLTIAYDTVNGTRNMLDEDGDSEVDVVHYTEQEIEDIRREAEMLLKKAQDEPDAETFETLARTYSDNYSEADANNGAFLNTSTDYSYDLLNRIGSALAGMEPGQVTLIESDDGFHILRKYPLTEGAWNDESNANWFSGFTSEVTSQMFTTLTEKEFDKIVFSDKITVPSIRDVATNWLGLSSY